MCELAAFLCLMASIALAICLPPPTLGETLFIRKFIAPLLNPVPTRSPPRSPKTILGVFHHPTHFNGFTFPGPCHCGWLPSIYLSGSHIGWGVVVNVMSCGERGGGKWGEKVLKGREEEGKREESEEWASSPFNSESSLHWLLPGNYGQSLEGMTYCLVNRTVLRWFH